MIKTLLAQVKEFKKASFLTPVFMILEVVVETMIPLVMADMIDNGVEAGNISYLYRKGACYKFGKGVFHGYDKEDSRYAGGVFHDIPVGGWCDVPSR